MLYEWRTYSFRPGQAVRYLEAFRKEGLPLVTRHLPMLGYWLTDAGRLNLLHHLWVYRDLDDRAACRMTLGADTEWVSGFWPGAAAMVEAQETWFLSLETGSPELEAAVAGARGVREAPPGELFAPGMAMVEFGGTGEPLAGSVATWRVVAGERPGTRVGLARWPGLPPSLPEGSAERREMMRTCAFSPL
ncbi:hypothetical protein HNP73_003520 [Amaricoccus macauensis]|uniref:NIPSNAP domain-containing protein n=1 Tax=Amaricoccus macauensis TaxID=57001 RepID=A0A840SUQ9_9RHOB|nr:NIPSNAP family protein [Amaricoccus macauensis]MBB5223566.1 hypothetical protein [Amaricoccus macauensis]